jgi:hypothetical protein
MMRLIVVISLIFGNLNIASAQKESEQSLIDHLVSFLEIPMKIDTTLMLPPEVFRMDLDVTYDGVPELFLGSTWRGSRQGIPWIIYYRDPDNRYKPLGYLEFGMSAFYYSEKDSGIYALKAGGPRLPTFLFFYHIGKDGVREVEEKGAGMPLIQDEYGIWQLDTVAAKKDSLYMRFENWSTKKRPPIYVIPLQELQTSASPRWRDATTDKIKRSLGKLDAKVTESGDCSAEKFLDEYRKAGCSSNK